LEKVGNSWKKLELVGKSWKKLEKLGKVGNFDQAGIILPKFGCSNCT